MPQNQTGTPNPKEAFVTFLPEPGEALINFFRHIEKEGKGAKQVKLGLSSLEAPSALLAVQLYQIEKNGVPDIAVTVDQIQDPDPRLPRSPVDFTLWQYLGTEPKPKFRDPSEKAERAAGDMAGSAYDRNRWAEAGHSSALALGPGAVKDLLAVMVSPPPRREPFPMWVWLQRVQIAAAFILAGMDAGWEGSIRRRCLVSLSRGPMDWTVSAALLPLSLIAEQEPQTAEDIGGLYLDLITSLPRPGDVPYEYPLLWCISELVSRKLGSEPLRRKLTASFRQLVKPGKT